MPFHGVVRADRADYVVLHSLEGSFRPGEEFRVNGTQTRFVVCSVSGGQGCKLSDISSHPWNFHVQLRITSGFLEDVRNMSAVSTLETSSGFACEPGQCVIVSVYKFAGKTDNETMFSMHSVDVNADSLLDEPATYRVQGTNTTFEMVPQTYIVMFCAFAKFRNVRGDVRDIRELANIVPVPAGPKSVQSA